MDTLNAYDRAALVQSQLFYCLQPLELRLHLFGSLRRCCPLFSSWIHRFPDFDLCRAFHPQRVPRSLRARRRASSDLPASGNLPPPPGNDHPASHPAGSKANIRVAATWPGSWRKRGSRWSATKTASPGTLICGRDGPHSPAPATSLERWSNANFGGACGEGAARFGCGVCVGPSDSVCVMLIASRPRALPAVCHLADRMCRKA